MTDNQETNQLKWPRIDRDDKFNKDFNSLL